MLIIAHIIDPAYSVKSGNLSRMKYNLLTLRTKPAISMKRLRYLFFILAASSLNSCDNLTEEIHINADGSGEYVFYTDMIPGIRKMTSEMFMLFEDSMTDESIVESLEDSIWKDFPDAFDSIIDYSEILPDSVLSDPENQEVIKKMKFFMEGGRSKGYVNMGFRFGFKDLSELEDVLKKVEDNQHSSGAGGGMMPELDEMRTDIKYELKENVLKRKTVLLSKPDFQQTDIEMLELFMADAKMKTIVHTPEKVKTVTGSNAQKLSDTSVMFEYNMLDYIMGKASSDFEIVMEKQ